MNRLESTNGDLRGGPRPRATTRLAAALRLVAALVAMAWTGIAACERNVQGLAHEGVVAVWITTPHAYDQAVLIVIGDPSARFSPAPGFRAFPDPARSGAVLIVADTPLPLGEMRVGSLEAPDVAALEAAGARVLEIARSDFALRESNAGYAVRLVRSAP